MLRSSGDFGPEVVGPDGRLNRARLADLAFRHGRLQELNAIVHPPVIEAQIRWMNEVFARDPSAVAVIESALIFEVVRDARARGEKESILADWRKRIDRIIVVTAPDELKIQRYAARTRASSAGAGATLEAIEADARNRLAHQVPDAEKIAQADYVLDNSGDIESLQRPGDSALAAPQNREQQIRPKTVTTIKVTAAISHGNFG